MLAAQFLSESVGQIGEVVKRISWQVKLTSKFLNGRIELGFKAIETTLEVVFRFRPYFANQLRAQKHVWPFRTK